MSTRRVIFWGTYDDEKPRVRILRDGLARQGYEILEINRNIWRGVRDKSVDVGVARALQIVFRASIAYVWLLAKLIAHRDFSKVIVVPYLGQFDVIVVSPLARLLRRVVVLDVFISLYDTVVCDRQLLPAGRPPALLLRRIERCAIKAPDLSLIDTAAHARRLEDLFALPARSVSHVLVGAEDAFTPQAPLTRPEAEPLQVLFYGQLSPLHGVETILAAADLLAGEPVDWLIIGTGQSTDQVRRVVNDGRHRRVRWLEWVPYVELPATIAAADVCLGIFGRSEKAASVIPNKAFQVASIGRHLVTRDGPAIRELFQDGARGVSLVPPEDPKALAQAILALAQRKSELRTVTFHADVRSRITPTAVGQDFATQLEALCQRQA
jgi:glycosyltransferase involved in cell wall biosynthesis